MKLTASLLECQLSLVSPQAIIIKMNLKNFFYYCSNTEWALYKYKDELQNTVKVEYLFTASTEALLVFLFSDVESKNRKKAQHVCQLTSIKYIREQRLIFPILYQGERNTDQYFLYSLVEILIIPNSSFKHADSFGLNETMRQFETKMQFQ